MAKQLETSVLSLLALLPLFIVTVSADVFISIDCGSSKPFYDKRDIPWDGDDLYIQHGRSVVLKNPGSVSQAMITLRVFDSRRKSCYRIAVSGGGLVLARASFYYGNYDGKSSPPSFALQFDANSWTTVVTALDKVVSYEAIYDVGGDATSVCVAQTQPNQTPFVSAIEVRSLESDMYANVDSNRALFLNARVAFGAQDIVRYSDDIYDRIWIPSSVPNGMTALASDTQFINVDVIDKPPELVLETAIAPTQLSSGSLILRANLPTSNVPICINMYFSEMSELDSTQIRSFEIYVDDVNVTGPISPPYAGVVEHSFPKMTANSSTAIALKATADSTLPPIISAMEFFIVSDPLSNGTNANDVNTLAMLQQEFEVLQDWSGDPCLPVSYYWEWVNCSSDETPRITALYLSGFGLTGFLPDLSGSDALEIIDLHNNSFTGEIPDFLGNLPNLRELNLADNSFLGSIPSSLTQNTKLKLDVSGNPDLCTSGQSCDNSDAGVSVGGRTTYSSSSSGRKKGSKNLGLALGLSLPFYFLFCVALATFFFFFYRRRNAPTSAANNTGQMNHHGDPSAPHQAVPTHTTSTHHMNEDNRIEIERQMESELADLMNQQAQAYPDGTNTDTNSEPLNQDAAALRYQCL